MDIKALTNEGDSWFLRNRDALLKKDEYPYLDQITSFLKSGETFLEMGCSFGCNVNHMSKRSGARGFGVDPSDKAIEFGSAQYKDITLKKGTIAEVDKLFDQKFDHVILGFCLYIVEEELLPEVVYSVDKVLKKSGHVHIFDFDTKYPVNSIYGHNKDIKIKKMDYSQIFTAFPNYYLVEKNSWKHGGVPGFHLDLNERCSTMTIFKEL